jgi:hypothetical protein
MNIFEFKLLLNQTTDRLFQLTETKGHEYAHDADQLANFRRLGTTLRLDPRVVLYVYLLKHLDAISHYIGAVQHKREIVCSEPIDGRIDDAILYLILLKALIMDEGFSD